MTEPASPRERDLRDGKSWTHPQRAKNDLLYAIVTLALSAASLLPRRALPSLGRALGRLAHAWLGRARDAALANIAACFPAWPAERHARLAREVFLRLGEDLADTVALLDAREPASRGLALPEPSKLALEEALSRGRGVVYVTAHLGPWERMAALLAERGFPITTVARESYDPRFDRLYDRLRAARGVRAIYRGRPGAPAAIVRALARGAVVGFPMDLPGRVPTIPVTLLGLASRLPVGPARIALRRGAAVVVGTPAPGERGELCVRIEPLATADLAGGAADEAALTQRIADALGERVAALPSHWPFMHPSFDTPPGRGDATGRTRLPLSGRKPIDLGDGLSPLP